MQHKYIIVIDEFNYNLLTNLGIIMKNEYSDDFLSSKKSGNTKSNKKNRKLGRMVIF